MKTTPILLFLALLMAANLSAYSLWECATLGNEAANPDARSAAMADASVAGGRRLLNLLANPANLAAMPDGLLVQAGFGVTMNDDQRSTPLYDSFDSVVDEATYASNTNNWNDFSAAAAYGYEMGVRTVFLGLHRAKVRDYNAHYEEEVRTDDNSDNDTYPPVIAWNELDSDGELNATGFDLSVQCRRFDFWNWIALGFTYEIFDGDRTWEKRVVWTEAARDSVQTFVLPDDATKIDSKWEGSRWRLGALAQLNDRLAVGAAYTAKATLDETDKTRYLTHDDEILYSDGYGAVTETTADYILPASVRVGLSYRPRNFWQTYVNLDAEWVKWSDVSDVYDDAFRWYLGVEHRVWQSVPLRFGFRWETSPLDNSIAMPTITGGAGFEVMDNLALDIALHYTHRTYHAGDLFPDGYYDDTQYSTDPDYESTLWNYTVPADRTEQDKVDEFLLGLQLSLSYRY